LTDGACPVSFPQAVIRVDNAIGDLQFIRQISDGCGDTWTKPTTFGHFWPKIRHSGVWITERTIWGKTR
jgi:hypothetical protein